MNNGKLMIENFIYCNGIYKPKRKPKLYIKNK